MVAKDKKDQMTHIFRVILACLITISLFISSCVREDDEPIVPENSITRLYISYSDYQSNEDLDPYENVVIIDPADREDLFSVNLKHTSEARGGAALHFSPFAKRLFQSSINTPGRPDTAIYIMSVGNTGVLANSDKGGGKILNSKLNSVKGIFYYSEKDRLYATNLQDSSIYVFNRPSSLNRYALPNHTFKITDARPWKSISSGQDVYIVKTGSNGGVAIYKNLFEKEPSEDVVENLTADAILTVEGSTNIRGIDYDKERDILLLTDYNADNQGRVLFFENFSALAAESKNITPTREIKGNDTGLLQPIDIAADKREGSLYFYVADQEAKKISRFKLDGSGNVEPDKVYSSTLTPVGISLDARGPVGGNKVPEDKPEETQEP